MAFSGSDSGRVILSIVPLQFWLGGARHVDPRQPPRGPTAALQWASMDAHSGAPVRKPRHGDELIVEVSGYDRRGRAVGRALDGEGRAYKVSLRGA
ncbi:MAG: hypothetical protein QF391_15590, partial [Myxococcota bacterium]|nr:hypothetical protein [Myxococcota bacterium]